MTPAAHSAIPYSPNTHFPLAIHSSKSPPSPSIYRCCHLFTVVTTCLPLLPTVSASASAAIHRRLLLPLVLHHQKRN
jgi:hypothetical protein